MQTYRVILHKAVIDIRAHSKEKAFHFLKINYGITNCDLVELPYFKYSKFHKTQAIHHEKTLGDYNDR